MSHPARFRHHTGLTRPAQTQQDSTPANTHADQRREPAPTSENTNTADGEQNPTPLLYTPEEAATLLRVRASWLRRKATARTIPCRFLGKHLRFAQSDLEAITALNTHQPGTP